LKDSWVTDILLFFQQVASLGNNMAIQIAAFLFSAGRLQALSQGLYADLTALHYLLWSL